MCRCLNFGFWLALSFLSCQINSSFAHLEGEMSICAASPNCYILTHDFKKDVSVTDGKGVYTTFCYEGIGMLGLLSSGLIEIEKKGFLGVQYMYIILHHGKSVANLEETAKSTWTTLNWIFTSNHGRYLYDKMDITETSCILVDADGDFNLHFKVTYFDLENIMKIVIGLIVFSMARSFVHYIVGSALYIVGFFPFCLYIFWLEFFLIDFGRKVLKAYFVTLGVLGAGYFLRSHGITDYITINIMTWIIQALALLMIWTGVQITWVGTTFCISIIFVRYSWSRLRLEKENVNATQ